MLAVTEYLMGPSRFEQSTKTSVKPPIIPPPNTESNTVDRDLQSVIDAWPNLPGNVRRTIGVLIDASKPGGMT